MNLYLYIPVVLLTLALILFGISVPLASYLAHVEMNKEQGKPYDWCSFKTFLIEFNSHFDLVNTDFNTRFNSIFIKSDQFKYGDRVYLHASIIKFDDSKCMILYPWSFFKYCKWKKKMIETKGAKRIRGLYRREKND